MGRTFKDIDVQHGMTHEHHPGPTVKTMAEPNAGHGHGHGHMVADFRRRFWISLALTIPVLALAEMIQHWLGLGPAVRFPGDRWVELVLASVIYLYGGWPFLLGMVREVGARRPGMMTLVALAISVAYGYSVAVVLGLPGMVFFWETATLIDLMLLGHWIEMRSVMGASEALEKLVALMPADAHRMAADGSVTDVAVAALRPRDRVLVKPGEKIPADGRIAEGRTTVNEAALTGESQPVERGERDRVIGGAVNGEAAIVVEVTRTGSESYLSQVVELVRRARETRSRTQDLADRAAFVLTLTALLAGAVTLLAWLPTDRPFHFALERMVTVMVITCPHALGLAIPLVVAVSTTLAARRGLLIRDRSAFERARDLDAVIFDKTGTLTQGQFGVTEVIPLSDVSADEILRVAAAVESRSEHPIALGIIRTAEQGNLAVPSPSDFRAIPGKGAQATVNGLPVAVVSPGYLSERNIPVDDPRVRRSREQGQTVVFLLVNDRAIGAIALADLIRDESREAVRRLKAMGIEVMMLTGDAGPVARSVADSLELDAYFAEVLPDQKAATVAQVQRRGRTVAMVGDGVNDAPALAAADVGIAIGAGTDVAIESADVVLVRSDPRDVVTIIQLARATYRKMVQNLWWATGYNVVAIPLAAGALAGVGLLLSPAVGAVLMSASTVVVALNARLLGRQGGREVAPPAPTH